MTTLKIKKTLPHDFFSRIVPRMSINVLMTPERLDRILRCGLEIYRSRHQRAAARGALMDAATLCDAMASETLAQYRLSHGKRVPSKAVQDIAVTFKRAGDEIMRMRDRVSVPRDG